MRFRDLVRPVAILTGVILFLLSCYHYYTAGFGIPQATVHRGLHLAATTFLVFMSFSAFGRQQVARGPLTLLGLPLVDWLLAVAGAAAALALVEVVDEVLVVRERVNCFNMTIDHCVLVV